MPERLSYDRAVELAEQVVDEFGADHIYQEPDGGSCFYVRDGCPDCLVAHVLTRAGVPVEEMAVLDALMTDALGDSSVRFNWSVFERWAEPQAVRFLADAQDQQDSGASWSYALEHAANQQIGEDG
jgi:hypothetical protein